MQNMQKKTITYFRILYLISVDGAKLIVHSIYVTGNT